MRTLSRHGRALVAIAPFLAAGPAACLGNSTPVEEPGEEEKTDVARSALVEPTCVTIRRGEAGDVFDTFLSGDHPTWAPGTSSDLWIGGSSGGNENRTLFGFDLSPVPAGSTVTEASFHFRVSWNQSNGQIGVHRVLVPWSEATATSTNFDVAGGIVPSPEMTFPGIVFGWRSLDFTSLVSGWVGGAFPNHGVLMQEDPAHKHLVFGSEASSASRPYLVVCYQPPAPVCSGDEPAVDADRSFVMSKQLGGSNTSYSLGIDDLGGDTVTAGFFAGSTVIGGVPLATTGAGDHDLFVARIAEDGHAVWAKRFGDATSQPMPDLTDPRDGKHGVAVGPDGRVVVAGGFRGTVDFGGGALVSPGGATDIFVAVFDASGNHLWSKSFGGALGDGRARSVAVGADGRLLIGGGFTGTIDFGGGALSQPSLGGEEDGLFVAQLDASGDHLWSRQVGNGSGPSRANDVGFDLAGNVLLTGVFGGAVDLGDGPLVAAGPRDVLVAKLDPSGNTLWSRRYGDAGDSNGDRGAGIAASSAGDVYVAGTVDGLVDFGGGAVGHADGSSGFLLKLDPAGSHVFSKAFGAGSILFGTDVSVDALDRPFFLGWGTGQSVDFGGGPRSADGPLDTFVAGYCPSGNHLWSRAFGAAGGSLFGQALGVDAGGRLSFTGWFNGLLEFGGHNHRSGQDHTYVAKIAPVDDPDSDGDGFVDGEDVCPLVADPQQLDQDSDGTGDVCDATPIGNGAGSLVWGRLAGGAGFLFIKDIALDPAGATVIGGSVGPSASIDGVALTNPIFLAKLDAVGQLAWSKSWGVASPGNQVNSVAVNAQGRVFFVGQAAGTLELGGGLLQAGGGQDAFAGALDASGNHFWSYRWGDGQQQSATSVAVNAGGDPIVAGTFSGTMDLRGNFLSSAGQSDVFLARLDGSGNPIWAKRYGDAAAQGSPQMTVNAAGNIVLQGKLTGTMDFGDGVSLTATGTDDVYTAVIDPWGTALSAVVIPRPAGSAISAFEADSQGNIYLAGTFLSTVSAGGALLTSDEGNGAFVAKYSATGAPVYGRGLTIDVGGSPVLAVDGAGDAVIGGAFQETLETGGVAFEAIGPAPDAYVMKLDPAGGLLYLRRYGTSGSENFQVVAADAAGNAVFAGFGAPGLDLGAGPIPGPGSHTLLKLTP